MTSACVYKQSRIEALEREDKKLKCENTTPPITNEDDAHPEYTT